MQKKIEKSSGVKAVVSATAESNNYSSVLLMEENEIQIEKLDNKTTSEFTKKIRYLESQPEEQEIHTYINSAGGDISNVTKIIKFVKPGNRVQLITKASGKVKPVGVVLTAAGKRGTRAAEFGTKFILTNEKPYPKNSKEKDLSEDDKDTLKALGILTKRKRLVLKYILIGRAISANQAKRCGIIDIVEVFPAEDWSRENRIKYSKLSEQPVSQEQPVRQEQPVMQEQPISEEQPVINHEKAVVDQKTDPTNSN
ncbi:MAG: ATP-dependent Clp protease proteolytic subunit [Bacteroidetes bacterium]|nr:ATP-dependent Clp protease proteolytic subunit [Bacteroidota bacterium]